MFQIEFHIIGGATAIIGVEDDHEAALQRAVKYKDEWFEKHPAAKNFGKDESFWTSENLTIVSVKPPMLPWQPRPQTRTWAVIKIRDKTPTPKPVEEIPPD